MKRLVLIAMVVLLSSPIAIAQDFCEGDFDYDGDQDCTDLLVFISDFGRGLFFVPCPPDGPAPVPRTGQITQYVPGDDGELQKGVPWPNPRFTDNGNETVTDNLTGLMWLKDADCIRTNYPAFDNDEDSGIAEDGSVHWQHALDFVAGINDGTYSSCGGDLPYTDWRLPNIKELSSLIDYSQNDPALPFLFTLLIENEQSYYYWSGTSYVLYPQYVWGVTYETGYMIYVNKLDNLYVWPVRGGND